MAAPFVGNQDFRGYLNYLGSQGDNTAKQLIGSGGDYGFVDNSGKFTFRIPYSTATNAALQAASANYFSQYQKLNNPQPQNLVGNYYTPPAKAAGYDVSGNFSAAYGQAAQSQNPLYDKYINQLVTNQKLKTESAKNLYGTTVENLQTAQKNLEEANKVAGVRVGEDVATNVGKINTQTDEFQTDTGTQNATDRIALARAQANAGVSGTGSANQQTANAEGQRNTQESRQIRGFNEAKQQQEVAKARSFEDFATANRLGAEKTASGTKAAKFDLDNYIKTLNNEVETKKLDIEKSRKEAILAEQERIAQQRFQAFLGTLSDPVRVATINKYQGSF